MLRLFFQLIYKHHKVTLRHRSIRKMLLKNAGLINAFFAYSLIILRYTCNMFIMCAYVVAFASTTEQSANPCNTVRMASQLGNTNRVTLTQSIELSDAKVIQCERFNETASV